MWALLDGRKEKVGNFNVEPPSLFKGRGDHPKTGCIKVSIKHFIATLSNIASRHVFNLKMSL
jgi:DNA topoisomerase-1